jgi:hypothetical protein
MKNHPTTPLASGTINASGDTIEVVLVQPADMPAVIRIIWPLQPTVADPRRYAEVAAAAIRLLANASTELARRKATRRRSPMSCDITVASAVDSTPAIQDLGILFRKRRRTDTAS